MWVSYSKIREWVKCDQPLIQTSTDDNQLTKQSGSQHSYISADCWKFPAAAYTVLCNYEQYKVQHIF
jgi:hypothetical protein